ncbi:MAG: hypothetical protein Q9195_007676 [Heterodermia aff. obscurata]
MSLAFLKNLAFPKEKQPVQGGTCPARHPPFDFEKNRADEHQPPSPALTQKRSESSWLSCESSVDLEAQKHQSQSSTSSLSKCEPEPKRRFHFKPSPRMISDAIIGLSDGMTVPFALTAGLASLGDTRLVVLGGLAELIAGAISMGLGGLLGAKSEAESYNATVCQTKKMMNTNEASVIVHEVLGRYRVPTPSIRDTFDSLKKNPEELLDFLMRFHHQMPEPENSRPFVCAATIALGYFFGGFVPLLPYLCVKRNEVMIGLWWSISVMAVALFAFGWVKTGVVVGWRGGENVRQAFKSAVQMLVIGGVAAGAAVGLVRAMNHG